MAENRFESQVNDNDDTMEPISILYKVSYYIVVLTESSSILKVTHIKNIITQFIYINSPFFAMYQYAMFFSCRFLEFIFIYYSITIFHDRLAPFILFQHIRYKGQGASDLKLNIIVIYVGFLEIINYHYRIKSLIHAKYEKITPSPWPYK